MKQLTYAEGESSYWATQALDADALVTSSGADLLGCSRVTLKFTRSVPAGLSDDVCLTSFWVAKTVGGGLFSMIPLAELSALEPALDVLRTSWAAASVNDYTMTEYAWHQVNENSPRDKTGRGQKMGPATRITIVSTAGGQVGSRLPDQVAWTSTLRTVSRKHWGRSYWPGVDAGALQADFGRYTSSRVDTYQSMVSTLHDSWQTLGYQMGTWSMLHPAFLTPKAIEVDDIPDIVRRRRAKRTGYRKIT